MFSERFMMELWKGIDKMSGSLLCTTIKLLPLDFGAKCDQKWVYMHNECLQLYNSNKYITDFISHTSMINRNKTQCEEDGIEYWPLHLDYWQEERRWPLNDLTERLYRLRLQLRRLRSEDWGHLQYNAQCDLTAGTRNSSFTFTSMHLALIKRHCIWRIHFRGSCVPCDLGITRATCRVAPVRLHRLKKLKRKSFLNT